MDLNWENEWREKGFELMGIDEVGRGCIAGPVVAGAVIFPANHQKIEGIYDSKQLSARKREVLSKIIYQKASYVGIGQSEASIIDTKGIIWSLSRAMIQACGTKSNNRVIFVDGKQILNLNSICDHVETVVRGDQIVYSIAAASIVAKVYRDQLMKKYSQDYPNYGWDHNVGYGTKSHYQAIDEFGLTPLHRKSFIH